MIHEYSLINWPSSSEQVSLTETNGVNSSVVRFYHGFQGASLRIAEAQLT